MSEGSRERLRRVPARHPRPGRAADGCAGARGKAVLRVHHRGHGEVPGAGRAVRATRRWSTSCCRGSAAGSRSSRSSSSPTQRLVPARVLDVHVKPHDPVDAPLRHRGRGHAQLLRRRRDGAQLARNDHGRKGAEVLRLGPPGRPADRDAQGRHRRGRQPDPGQGRQEQGVARRSSRPSSTSSTARASARRARSSTWASSRASSASPAPGSPTRASSSARARRTPAPS